MKVSEMPRSQVCCNFTTHAIRFLRISLASVDCCCPFLEKKTKITTVFQPHRSVGSSGYVIFQVWSVTARHWEVRLTQALGYEYSSALSNGGKTLIMYPQIKIYSCVSRLLKSLPQDHSSDTSSCGCFSLVLTSTHSLS